MEPKPAPEPESEPAPEPEPGSPAASFGRGRGRGRGSLTPGQPKIAWGEAGAAQPSPTAPAGAFDDSDADCTAAQAKACQKRRAGELRGKERLVAKERMRWVEERAQAAREQERRESKNERLLAKLTREDAKQEKAATKLRERAAERAHHFLPPGTDMKKLAKTVRLAISTDTKPKDAKVVYEAAAKRLPESTFESECRLQWTSDTRAGARFTD